MYHGRISNKLECLYVLLENKGHNHESQTGGKDYLTVCENFVISLSETCVNISIIDDEDVECSDVFSVNISTEIDPRVSTSMGIAESTVTIAVDDGNYKIFKRIVLVMIF